MDPELEYGLLGYLSLGKVPGNIGDEVQKLIEKVADHYIINKNHLIRVDHKQDTHGGRQQFMYCTIINTHKKATILHKAHDKPLGGHLGQENTYQRLSQQYYWPGMRQDIINYVKTCRICQK
jgi:hypothetical protein